MLWGNFDKNEISIIVMIVLGYVALWILPKKLPRNIAILSLFWGLASGMLFDFTIGGGLMDFYKVNDSQHYEVFDFFYYVLFTPSSYFFIYFYEILKINKKTFVWYVLGWSLIGLAANWVLTKLDIIHFQNGYVLSYSFAVFLVIQTLSGLYYELIKLKQKASHRT